MRPRERAPVGFGHPRGLRPGDPCWYLMTRGGGGGSGQRPSPVVPLLAVYLGFRRPTGGGAHAEPVGRVRVRLVDPTTGERETWVGPDKVWPR